MQHTLRYKKAKGHELQVKLKMLESLESDDKNNATRRKMMELLHQDMRITNH